jgi:nitrate reductase NapD
MPVSGIVLTCGSGTADDVATRIGTMDGVEVQGVVPGDRVVAVLEADSVDGEVSLFSRLHEVDGVQTVRLAYHNFEDIE